MTLVTPTARADGPGWSEIRIDLARGARDDVLLSVVAPWLEEHRRSERDREAAVFFLRERKGARQTLAVWIQAATPQTVAALVQRLHASEDVPRGAIGVSETSGLGFADGTYTGPRASALLGGLLSEVTPAILDRLVQVDGNAGLRNEAALEMMVSHLAATDFYAVWPERYPDTDLDVDWPRTFVVYRSHADGFMIMTKDPAATKTVLDRRYEGMGEQLPRRIAQLLADRSPGAGDVSLGATWFRIARRYLLEAEAALRSGGLTIRWEDGYLGDAHDLSVSSFHQAFQDNPELRRFQRTDVGFQAMRFTMGALYLVLNNLGIRLIDRYFLCHAISRTCQERYGVDPAALVLSQVPRQHIEGVL